jgi:hypothetical protein
MIDEKLRDQFNALGAHYVLKDRVPVRIDFSEWIKAVGERKSLSERLWQTDVGDACVSTIFLGFAVHFGRHPPLLFETMIFGGARDLAQWRYATYDEAEAGHAAAVQAAKDALQ